MRRSANVEQWSNIPQNYSTTVHRSYCLWKSRRWRLGIVFVLWYDMTSPVGWTGRRLSSGDLVLPFTVTLNSVLNWPTPHALGVLLGLLSGEKLPCRFLDSAASGSLAARILAWCLRVEVIIQSKYVRSCQKVRQLYELHKYVATALGIELSLGQLPCIRIVAIGLSNTAAEGPAAWRLARLPELTTL